MEVCLGHGPKVPTIARRGSVVADEEVVPARHVDRAKIRRGARKPVSLHERTVDVRPTVCLLDAFAG